MNPFFLEKGGAQFDRILMLSFQVSLFAVDRFAFVSFFKHTEDSYHHLFVQGWKDDIFISYYSRQEVINAVKFANQRVSFFALLGSSLSIIGLSTLHL